MAITFDSQSYGYNASTKALTFSHTVGSGSNRILIYIEGISYATPGTLTGVTFNGIPLTQAVSASDGERKAYIYYLINPPIGTYNIIASSSGTGNRTGAAASFFGVKQTSPLGATNTKTGTAQNKSIDITTQSDNSVIIDCIGAGSGTHTPTAGQTLIQTAAGNRVGSYEVVGAAGAYTQTWSSTTSANYAMVVAEFKEALVMGGAFLLNFV